MIGTTLGLGALLWFISQLVRADRMLTCSFAYHFCSASPPPPPLACFQEQIKRERLDATRLHRGEVKAACQGSQNFVRLVLLQPSERDLSAVHQIIFNYRCHESCCALQFVLTAGGSTQTHSEATNRQ